MAGGPQVGEQIGVFRIDSLLGVGGMGEVYRAHDTKLNRNVAIKVLPAAFANDSDRLARFRREAQVLASLNHPNIGGIHGLEDQGGTHALILELIDGPTLADRLAQGPIPLDEAVAIARQIADALEAAHEQGIIHRDLKPANIKVRDDGTAKVLDFGLAKLAQQDSALQPGVTQSPTITTPAMTAAGVILGTAAYMSPEQAKGRVADRRSDIWAFGCVFYEMVTGRRAFHGEDVSDTLALILRGEPDWAMAAGATSPSIVTLMRRCLERDARRRIGSMSTVRYLLDEIPLAIAADAETSRATTAAVEASVNSAVVRARSQLVRTRVLPIAGLALVSTIAAGVALWRRTPAVDAPVARFTVSLGDSPVASTGRHSLAISGDGTQFAYISTGGRLLRRRIDEFEAQVIFSGSGVGAAPVAVNSPVFSPDGRALAFFAPREGEVRRLSVSGGASVTTCRADPPFGMTWETSGILVGQGSKGIVRCSGTGGAAEVIATVDAGEEAHGPHLLPDGRTLIFSIAKVADGQSRWDRAVIVAQPLPSGQRQVLIRGGSDARYVSTGHLIYAIAGTLLAAPFDPGRVTVTGEPIVVLEGVRRPIAWNTGAAQFATSVTGTLLYVPGPVNPASSDMLLATADRGGAVTNLPTPRGSYSHVRASPDGVRLVIGTDDGGEAIVWTYRMGSNAPMQRLTLTGRNRYPIWSPDGQRVAFQSDRGGDRAVYVQRVDGVGVADRLTTAPANETHIPESWSPDGSQLSVAINRDNTYSLALVSSRNGDVRPFGDVRSSEPIGSVFSPDGKWIAYASSPNIGGGQSPARGIFVQPVPPTGQIFQAPQQGLDFHPVWSRDGKALIWVPSAASNRVAIAALSTQSTIAFGDVALVPQRVTADRTSGGFRAYDVLPDGRFVGITFSTESDVSRITASDFRVVLNWFTELKGRVSTGR